MHFLIVVLYLGLNQALGEYFSIKWSRPRVGFSSEEFNYDGFVNSFNDYVDVHKIVNFDICDSEVLKKYPKATVKWEFSDVRPWPAASSVEASKKRQEVIRAGLASFNTTQTCKFAWRAPRESRYFVKATVLNKNQHVASKQLYMNVEDIWLVAVGDSFVSGEGNPDVQAAFLVLPRWVDGLCGRSAKGSFAYLTYDEVQKLYPNKGIMFSFLACSGASVDKGLLGEYLGNPPQLEVIYDIQEKAKKGCCESCCRLVPDVVIMGIGGNDLQFSKVLKTFLIGMAESHYVEIPQRLKALDKKLDNVANVLNEIGVNPRGVFYMEYYDPLRNHKGQIDSSCKRTGVADNDDFYEVNAKIFTPLNRLMKKKAAQHRWTFVDGIDEIFSTHGLCSNQRYIRTIEESVALQLNVFGAYHPTYQAQQHVAKNVWGYVRNYIIRLPQNRGPMLNRTTTTVAATRTTPKPTAATTTLAPFNRMRVIRP